MTPEEYQALFAFLGDIGGNAILLFVLYGLVTGRLVTRFHYDEMIRLHEQRIERLLNGRGVFPFPDEE